MKEIEVKILEIDRKALVSRLEELGAEKSFDGEMLALFFDTEEGNIYKSGDVLRLRKEGEETVLTYKKFISQEEAKIMEEFETSIGDIVQMRAILDLLNFKVTKKTRKFRTQYELGDTHVVIDNYQDELEAIPEFMEIEAPGMERISEVLELLGYSVEDCKSWHTYDLIKHYKLTENA
ncbi:MAG: class IV adenylate cyclase [Bacteroidota bacterium]